MSILDRSESRNGRTVRLLTVHSTEGNGTAQELRDAVWWTGSSHAINDETGTLLTPAHGCVPYERAAWTLRSGNAISDNLEQVGWARYTRTEWLARPKLLETTAQWLAERSKARGIPLVKLSPADVKAGRSGVIGHVDWTVGMSDGSHSDPGPNYPWDVVIARAKAINSPEDDLTAQFETDVRADLAAKQKQLNTIVEQLTGGGHTLNADLRGDLQAKGQQLTALTSANSALTQLVASQNGLTVADVEAAVERAVAKGVDVAVTVQSAS